MEIETFLSKLLILLRTKELPREGYIQYGMKRNDTDTIAAHTFGVGIIAYFLAKYLQQNHIKIDLKKVLEFALLHDTGESVTGDFGVFVKDMLGRENFDLMESNACKWLYSELDFGQEILEVMKEYEDRTSLESRIVKCADHIDAVITIWVTPSIERKKSLQFHTGESILQGMIHESCGNLMVDLYKKLFEICSSTEPEDHKTFVLDSKYLN